MKPGRNEAGDAFAPYLQRWQLVADGMPVATHSSDLLPVRREGSAAMLKIVRNAEEERGNRLMAAWAGNGAAAVLARDGPAILLERATESRSLPAMSKNGQDELATGILCDVANRLHRNRLPRAELMNLREWFTELRRIAARDGGWLARAAAIAGDLLADDQDPTALHGDLHHWNVLDFGGEWRAIDPKGLYGERTFEFANLLRNPDAETAEAPGRLARHADIVASRAEVDRDRLLKWTFAFAGLSAAWLIGEGEDPKQDSAIARIVAPMLGPLDPPGRK